MYCKFCGAEIKDGQKFCGKCGKPASENTATAQQTESTPTGTKQNRPPVIPITAVIIVLVVIVLIALLHSCGSSQEMTEIPEEIQADNPTTDGTPVPSDSLMGNVTISDAQIDIIPYALDWTCIERGFEEDRYRATQTITNNNDLAVTVTLSFECQRSFTDGYGDPYVETKTEEHLFNLAAQETKQMECILDISLEEEDYSYTGNITISDVQAYEGDARNGEVLLPLSVITNTEMNNQGVHHFDAIDDEYNCINVLFTLTNNTEDRWARCYVDFHVYYDGIYVDVDSYWGDDAFNYHNQYGGSWYAKSEYIKPGEETEALEDFGSNPAFDYTKITIVPTQVSYNIDSDY